MTVDAWAAINTACVKASRSVDDLKTYHLYSKNQETADAYMQGAQDFCKKMLDLSIEKGKSQ